MDSIKRGRGRPKGSTNKAKEDQEVSNLKVGGTTGTTVKPSTSYVKQQRLHTYTELANTSLGHTELYNLYGIVIDASAPHPKQRFFR